MAKYVGFKVGKVHESHVISEYYCGGCGYPVTDHDSFCPECGGAFQESDADSTEAENAKLRSELESVGTAAYLYGRGDLQAENAKLRELARDLRFCARQSICLKCEHGRFCDLRLDERCTELGIEAK